MKTVELKEFLKKTIDLTLQVAEELQCIQCVLHTFPLKTLMYFI